MTYTDKLEAKLAEAQASKAQATEQAQEKLLDNDNFIQLQLSIATREKAKALLSDMLAQVNSIKPFIANDGRKFSVNAYAIGIFGPAIAELVGVVGGSRSAFTDDMSAQYEAITGLKSIELGMAAVALGQPAYFKDGELHDAIDPEYDTLYPLMQSVSAQLGILDVLPDKSTFTSLVSKWHVSAHKSAVAKCDAYESHEIIDTNQFVIED